MTYDPDGDDRGTGRTSQQMRDAPEGAAFVWCNERREYAQRLATHLGRADLKVIRPSDLQWAYSQRRQIVVDHAAQLTGLQRATLATIRSREAS